MLSGVEPCPPLPLLSTIATVTAAATAAATKKPITSQSRQVTRRRYRARVAKRSAGILLYRIGADGPEVLLVHPGGPLWQRRDEGAWSIPKGEVDDAEDALACARREFAEELGSAPPHAAATDLGTIRQRGGKLVSAWALQGDLDVTQVRSNSFSMEWPPRTGQMSEFPEIDRAQWFPIDQARSKIIAAQAELLDRLLAGL